MARCARPGTETWLPRPYRLGSAPDAVKPRSGAATHPGPLRPRSRSGACRAGQNRSGGPSPLNTDLEIARRAKLKKVVDLASEKFQIPEDHLEPYGHYKAKLSPNALSPENRGQGKLILVTAISPTPAGEGKTTTVVGLGDALNRLGKKALICLREPSLGPCFGMKGGAAGGGMAQVVPHGRHQPALYRRLSRPGPGAQSSGRHAGQPHPPGKPAGSGSPAGDLESSCGPERPCPASNRPRSGRGGQQLSQGRRL